MGKWVRGNIKRDKENVKFAQRDLKLPYCSKVYSCVVNSKGRKTFITIHGINDTEGVGVV